MYDGNDDTKPPCIGERYAGAISEGSTRVGNDSNRGTPGDIVAAAGMGRYRLGQALMRLSSEWHSGAVPKAGKLPDVKDLARRIASQRIEAEIAKKGTLKRPERDEARAKNTITKADMDLAAAQLKTLTARATDWTGQENQLRFQRLKTLPEVRRALLHWATERGWEDAEHLIAQVLQRFLSPVCPECDGSGLRVTPGTLGREITMRCKAEACQKDKGMAKVPYGGRGQRLLDHLEVCKATAAHDLRQGLRKARQPGNTEARENMRAAEAVEMLTRADREAEADAKQDTAAVAEHFRRSMGSRGRSGS
jgi:hypothetical protein